MGLVYNNKNVSSVYYGDRRIYRMYRGDTLVYEDAGEVYSWGFYSYGQLGLTDPTPTSIVTMPTKHSTNNDAYKIVALYAGYQNTCAINEADQLLVCGEGTYGQIGAGFTENVNSFYVHQNIKAISAACGYKNTYFIDKSNTLWSCGANGNGQLGTGSTSTTDSAYFKQNGSIGEGQLCKKVVAGDECVHVLSTTGDLWGCGKNTSKEVGVGSSLSAVTTFTKLPSSVKFADVCFYRSSGCALDVNGKMWVWGYTSSATSGTNSSSVPIKLSDTITFKKVVAGSGFFMGLGTNGTLYVVGSNSFAQLGLSNVDDQTELTPCPTGEVSIIDISCGDVHSMFLTDSGDVYMAGSNKDKQLGFGSAAGVPVLYPTFTKLSAITGMTGISAGYNYSFAFRK